MNLALSAKNNLYKNRKTLNTMNLHNIFRNTNYVSLILKTILIINCFMALGSGTRIKRAIMMKMKESDGKCQESTITQSNATSSIVLTATVKKCDNDIRKTSYSCSIQVWRIMKGRQLADNLTKVIEHGTMTSVTHQRLSTIYGLGNPTYCDSDVKDDNTRIFFLNRINDRLVLSSSVLRITLKNLQNTQKVIEGKAIEEPPKKTKDPCVDVLCGFQATCQVTTDNQATCVCPDFMCGKDEVFAPVCGSDGITYASECRLTASQCWKQSRIRIASRKPCEPDCLNRDRFTSQCNPTLEVPKMSTVAPKEEKKKPITEDNPCKSVVCGNSAVCKVSIVDDIKTANCECPTCDDKITRPVCGSDQTSYRTECDLKRSACLSGQDILVVRRSSCSPCEKYNEETNKFERTCNGICSLDNNDQPICCDSIPCDEIESGTICGNDGNTYASKCAMERQACRMGKKIEKLKDGNCIMRNTTIVRGSVSIAADENCPGNCDPEAPEFKEFQTGFEKLINEELVKKNAESIDVQVLTDFKINEVRTGSSVLVYSAVISVNPSPITKDYVPGSDTLWAFLRVHDPASGAAVVAARTFKVNFVDYREPLDDFYAEDVCENVQCHHGSTCFISIGVSGNSVPKCQCPDSSIALKLPVTHACKRADNQRIYINNAEIHATECATNHYFTFKDICRDPPKNLCDDHKCDTGTMCVVQNGEAVCECKTCEEGYMPVCGSNEQTYKNPCELDRYNCLNGLNILVQHKGSCGSPCDNVDCVGLEQCVETPHNTATCVCPSTCINIVEPVCGTDGKSYDNECLMTVTACNSKIEISVAYQGKCDGRVITKEDELGSGEVFEGSGDANECGCRFEATCDATVDDEDSVCVCNINCDAEKESLICASNGKSYKNDCERRKEQCETQVMITKKSEGECSGNCKTSAYGCCDDGVTASRGLRKAGCPEMCNCNKEGSFNLLCHPITEQCSCRPGIGGLTCNRCEPGFWNFRAVAEKKAVGCMSCQCHQEGSVRDDCDQMTGHCVCKKGMTGPKCSICEDTGMEITSTGCGKEPTTTTDSTCGSLNCRSNQNCEQGSNGKYSCQCPSLTSCENMEQTIVCGTDGITYANECRMRAITCRTGVDVTVEAEGTCKEFVKANEKLEENEKKVDKGKKIEITDKLIVPDLIIVPPATTASTTTTSTTTTSTTATTTTTTKATTTAAPYDGHSGSTMTMETGSGDDVISSSSLPPDDEDNEEQGSGEDMNIDMDKGPDKIIGVKHFKGSVTYRELDGFDDSMLAQNSEVLQEYLADMENQLNAIIKSVPEVSDCVVSVNVERFDKDADGKGLRIAFNLATDSNNELTCDDIAKKLNSLPLDGGRSGDFSITDADEDKDEIQKVAKSYTESSEWPTVPQFGGASYAEFLKLQNANIAITMEIVFRTSDSEGLLLYSGQMKAPAKDFISLSVNKGYVEFRFDTGSGPLMLRSNNRVDDGFWHTAIIRRNRKDGMLRVDYEQDVTGTTKGSTHGVDLDSGLFIGGFPNTLSESVLSNVGITKGLTGCIQKVYVVPSKQNLNFTLFDSIAKNFYRVAECGNSPCYPNPCENSANCFITQQSQQFTFKCQCKEFYKGDRCNQLANNIGACASNPCHGSATCVSNIASSSQPYNCICPADRKGVHCETSADDLPLINGPSYMPGFAGDSYIEHESLSEIGKHELSIEITFYSMQPDGVLFYNGQKKSGKGEFVSLNINNNYVEFMYDLGEGPIKIRSDSKITVNSWHVVKASRNGKLGNLIVDDKLGVKGVSPGNSNQLNVELPLYIGGVPDFSRVPESASITTGLTGAVQKLVINDKLYPQSLDGAVSSYNVRAFTGHACYRLPCMHKGTCIPKLGDFECNCTDGYTGKQCSRRKETTDEIMLQDGNTNSVYLNGRVAVRYMNLVTMSDRSVFHNDIEIEMRTTTDHGLLFYIGSSEDRGDYLAIGIQQGRLHLRFDLGSGPAFIETEEKVNDGSWKSIKLKREKFEATLQLDNNMPLHLSSPPVATTLNTDGILWIGGRDGLSHMQHRLPESFFSKFRGCIGSVKIREAQLHLRQDSLDGIWLPSCSKR